ncbi:hypothetical protein HDU79_001848 [Rhizoclosmatium sp. JEL0117]|nr:hypothetical protein HDU79_001848 [Rhizoclosmatium sp. JEL0117]
MSEPPIIVLEGPPPVLPSITATDAVPLISRNAARVKRYVASLYSAAGQKTEMKVWIAREMTLKLVCELEYGWFFNKNSYVIVNSRRRGTSQYTDIFVWIGAEASEIDVGHAFFKGREIREYIGLQNCAFHKEHQHTESTLFLSHFKYLRYTNGDRFQIPPNAFNQAHLLATFQKANPVIDTATALSATPETPSGKLNFAEAVLFAKSLSSQRQQRQTEYMAEAITQRYMTAPTNPPSQQEALLYAHDAPPFWIYNQTILPQTRPHLFRVHRASRVRKNASSESIVLEQITLSKDFETDVPPLEEGEEEDEDEAASKPPTANRLLDGRVVPEGWKVWSAKGFQVVREGVYVFEGVGFVWVFCGGGDGGSVGVVKNEGSTVNAKVDSGLNTNNGTSPERSNLEISSIGTGGAFSQKSDLEVEKAVAMEWAKEVAAVRGHGKVEFIDDKDIIINKIWITLGIPTKNLLNDLTASEVRLDVWQKEKEEEALENMEEVLDEDGNPVVPPPHNSWRYKDKTPFFHQEIAKPDPYIEQVDGFVLYRATETNIVRSLEYFEVERTVLYRSHLNSTGVFFLDAVSQVFVWVGSKCPEWLRRDSVTLGQEFLIKQKRLPTTPVTGLVEMGENEEFVSYFTEE